MMSRKMDFSVKGTHRLAFPYVVLSVPPTDKEETASEGSCKESKRSTPKELPEICVLLKVDLLEDPMLAPSLLRVLGN